MSLRPVERVALIVASLAAFITPFMAAATNVALPSIGRDFHADAVLLTWASASYLLSSAAILVPVGRLADIHGRKRTFTIGLAGYAVTSWLCAVSPSIGWLIAARALQGIAAAMVFGTNVAILTSVFTPERRGTALGLNVGAIYVGLSLGPFLGGLLVEHFGWRSIFTANVLLGVLAFAATVWRLEGEWADSRGQRFDLAGSALYVVALTALMYGLSRLPERNAALLTAAGATLMGAFVAWELRIPQPVLNLRLFARNRVLTMGNIAALINYSATFAVGFLLSFYLQYVKGLSPGAAGLVMVSQPIVMALVSPFAGRLSDRVQARFVASTGMASVGAGLFMLAAAAAGTRLWYIVISLVVLGCGFGLFTSPNTNAIMGAVERPQYGIASAMLATMRMSGQMASMAVAMLILTWFVGREAIGPGNLAQFLQAFRVAFVIFGALCVFGTYASMAREPAEEHAGAARP